MRDVNLTGQEKAEWIEAVAGAYYDDIYRFCCFQTGDREWAYDLAQETFLRFLRYAPGGKRGNVKGYLLTIAMNVCRDGWKERARRGREEPLEEGVLGENALQEGGAQERLLLQDALLRLPAYQREAILLHYVYGLKNGQIARMTQTNVSTVKSRIHQGCRKLREMLEGEGGTDG